MLKERWAPSAGTEAPICRLEYIGLRYIYDIGHLSTLLVERLRFLSAEGMHVKLFHGNSHGPLAL